jgi:hypothetical protein
VCYGKTLEYNEFYLGQMTELLTRWFSFLSLINWVFSLTSFIRWFCNLYFIWYLRCWF